MLYEYKYKKNCIGLVQKRYFKILALKNYLFGRRVDQQRELPATDECPKCPGWDLGMQCYPLHGRQEPCSGVSTTAPPLGSARVGSQLSDTGSLLWDVGVCSLYLVYQDQVLDILE